MANPSDTPTRLTPPPPNLPGYTPPVPSFATAPALPPLAGAADAPTGTSPPLESAPKLKIHLAPGPDLDLSPHGVVAPFNTRAIAAGIDWVLACGLYIAVRMMMPTIFGTSLPWLVGLAYLVTRDSLPFLGGQSVGKKAMHLQALTLDDKSLAGNWQPGLIRNAVLAIPLFALVELFVLLSREDKPEHGRRLGDEWAKTKVVVVQPEPAGAPTGH